MQYSGVCLSYFTRSVAKENISRCDICNIPEKRFQLCLAENEISELPKDSKKIFKRNMVDRYIDRKNLTSSSGRFPVLDAFCFAEFSLYYYLPSNPKYKENDHQPEELEMK